MFIAQAIGYLPKWVFGRSTILNILFEKMVKITLEEEDKF